MVPWSTEELGCSLKEQTALRLRAPPAAMLRLLLLLAGIAGVHSRPPLPPLPHTGGCYQVYPEVELFRVEGDAVILHFPSFTRALQVRKLAPPGAQFLISRRNGTGAFGSEGRVQQHQQQLWLLPAQVSDSGEYTCTYRNETLCVSGSISLHVYDAASVDVHSLSYHRFAVAGGRVELDCPSLDSFNTTDGVIEWYKDSSPAALLLDDATLRIPAVTRSHSGVYTCKLMVLINQQRYRVSRLCMLHVQGLNHDISTAVPQISTSDPAANSPDAEPPVIVSPNNGSIFESAHGLGLELFCHVLTECAQADQAEVTWLVNGRTLEASYLDKRALQGGRRLFRESQSCQIELRLVIATVTEEDEGTELKCVALTAGGRQEAAGLLKLEDTTFTWLVVATVIVCCFLTVVSIFLYAIFKPKKKRKMDYFLARQNSAFST